MKKLDEIKRGLGCKSKLSRLQASRLKGGASGTGGNSVPPPPPPPPPPPVGGGDFGG